MRVAAIVYSVVFCGSLWFLPEGDAKPEDAVTPGQFSGLADCYHHKFYGRKTASGEVLKKELLTAAHRTLPFGTRVRVTNTRTGHSCTVVINDRGPFTASKVIDLSDEAARRLDVLDTGTAQVACRVVAEDGEEEEE